MYVSNLSFNVQDEDLREFFAPYGEVTSAKIISDRTSTNPKRNPISWTRWLSGRPRMPS